MVVGLSQHPTDQLIRELILTGRRATPGEIEQIVERMATAPFNRQIRRVRAEEQGLTYRGRTLGASASSLFYHLVKRVLIEGQWAVGTTSRQYVDDLRRAVRSPDARLAVFARRGGLLAATLTPTGAAVATERRGVDALPILLVVYSASRGMIVSGYQISAPDKASIPEDAAWLR